MRAVVCPRYGPPDVLRLAEVPKPEPKPGEILIATHAATVTAGDCEIRGFRIVGWLWPLVRLGFGILRPRQPILGAEIAGVVAAVGKDVTRFAVGDRVFGSTGFRMGAYAEFASVSAEAAIAPIPEGLSDAEAAGIPVGGLNALHFLRRADLRPGESLLVNGAGGAIGTFAVQLARRTGAEVAAVDRGDKLDMLRELGAGEVFDYTREDFTRGSARYDVILDVVGTVPFAAAMAMLNPGGRLVLGLPRLGPMLRGLLANRRGDKRVLFQPADETVADLETLASLVAAEEIRVVIDRRFALKQAAEAHAYVEAGDKKGVAVIEVAGS